MKFHVKKMRSWQEEEVTISYIRREFWYPHKYTFTRVMINTAHLFQAFTIVKRGRDWKIYSLKCLQRKIQLIRVSISDVWSINSMLSLGKFNKLVCLQTNSSRGINVRYGTMFSCGHYTFWSNLIITRTAWST